MCSVEPSVNNAKSTLTQGTNVSTATYECLPGFSMSGSARITCDELAANPVWQTPPTCHVITQNTYVYNTVPENYEDWWYYLLAALLGLLVLSILGALIWCCCCTPTWCHMASVYPYHQNQQGKMWSNRRCCCCKKRQSIRRHDAEDRVQQNGHGDSVFWVNSKHNMPSVETPQPRETQLYRNTRPAKDPSKETKLWMPHSHNIRNINTSTK